MESGLEGGNKSTTSEGDFTKPDGDTESSATDEPDYGMYVNANVYVQMLHNMFSFCI